MTETTSQTVSKHWVQIVTSRCYTRERFIREAKRIGVNRTVNSHLLGQMEWGEKVLVADWQGIRRIVQHIEVANAESLNGKPLTKKKVTAPEGSLLPFGFYTVDTVIPQGFTDEAHKEFIGSLDIAGEVGGAPTRVVRGCGLYTLAGGFIVRDSIAIIVAKAEAVAKKHNLKLKWFVGGRYYDLGETKPISGMKWQMGYRQIELETPPVEGESLKQIQFMQDYERKTYVPKAEREQ